MQYAIWPDGTWCELEEAETMTWMSDDYFVVDLDDSGWGLKVLQHLGPAGISTIKEIQES